jgi:hypothetical protein
MPDACGDTTDGCGVSRQQRSTFIPCAQLRPLNHSACPDCRSTSTRCHLCMISCRARCCQVRTGPQQCLLLNHLPHLSLCLIDMRARKLTSHELRTSSYTLHALLIRQQAGTALRIAIDYSDARRLRAEPFGQRLMTMDPKDLSSDPLVRLLSLDAAARSTASSNMIPSGETVDASNAATAFVAVSGAEPALV